MDNLQASTQLKRATGTGVNDLLRNVHMPESHVCETLKKINIGYDPLWEKHTNPQKSSKTNSINIESTKSHSINTELTVKNKSIPTQKYVPAPAPASAPVQTSPIGDVVKNAQIDWGNIASSQVISFGINIAMKLLDDLFNGGETEERNPFTAIHIQIMEFKESIEKILKNIKRDIACLSAQVDIILNSVTFMLSYIKSETKFIIEQELIHHNIQYNTITNAITLIKSIESDIGIAFTQLAYSKLNSLLFKYETYEAKYEEPIDMSTLKDLCDLLEDIIINPPMINFLSHKSIMKFYNTRASASVGDIVIIDSLLKVYTKIRSEMKKRGVNYDRQRVMFNKLCKTIDNYNMCLDEQIFNAKRLKQVGLIDKLLTKYKLPQRYVYKPLAYSEFIHNAIGSCTNYTHCKVDDTGYQGQSIVNNAIDVINENQYLYIKPIMGNCMLYLNPLVFTYDDNPEIQQLITARNCGACDFQLQYKLDLNKTDQIGTVDDHYTGQPKIICKRGYNMDVFMWESLTFTVTVQCIRSDGKKLFTGTKQYTSPIYYADCGATGVINATVGLNGACSVMSDNECDSIVLLHPCNSYSFRDFSLNNMIYTFNEDFMPIFRDELRSHLFDIRNIKMQQQNADIDLIKNDHEYLNFCADSNLSLVIELDTNLCTKQYINIYNKSTRDQLELIKLKWTNVMYNPKPLSLLDYKSALEIYYI